eukprot:2437185-Rhodomonas_salina.2
MRGWGRGKRRADIELGEERGARRAGERREERGEESGERREERREKRAESGERRGERGNCLVSKPAWIQDPPESDGGKSSLAKSIHILSASRCQESLSEASQVLQDDVRQQIRSQAVHAPPWLQCQEARSDVRRTFNLSFARKSLEG